MVTRRKLGQREAQLAFEAITIEGGLLSPEWLAKIAQLQAEHQTAADYRVLKGLALRDEIGRYWRVAQAYWAEFKVGLQKRADSKSLSERFILGLLRESLGFSSLSKAEPVKLGGRIYPIGYHALEGRVPVVIAPAGSGLDALLPAFGEDGRRRSAFGLAQEVLNADEGALWGIATDGFTLRLGRDNASLTRPAWVEADLSRIFTEERYPDFAALWLMLHESRFGSPSHPVADCSLESWREAGREEGTRARDKLRDGVEQALVALGRGFLTRADNQGLRAALHSGQLSVDGYFQQLLRLVYRVIFLLTAEERGVLHPAGAVTNARALYEKGYSLRRLRDRAVKRGAHDRFIDLWEGLKIVFRGVADGQPLLALPALGGLFAEDQCPDIDSAMIENRWLLSAVFRLSWLREESGLSRVNWRDMGPEELGSVYESLLELQPTISEDSRVFSLAVGEAGRSNARKSTGSYYTPDYLVQALLDTALEPVALRAIAEHPEDPAEALLRLSVVDPASGSGHFLLAAARRLATHVARHQASGTPSAEQYRYAVRQVVSRCLFGVDLNPMAVELCRVSLWMEAVEPGRPLNFLDSHIQRGNALLGATPDLMKDGVPDDAFDPVEGDDKKTATLLKKRNRASAEGQRGLDTLWSKSSGQEASELVHAVAALDAAPDADLAAIAGKEALWEELQRSAAFRHQKFVADSWCSAFVWPKPSTEPKKAAPVVDAAPTNELWRQIRDGQGRTPPLTVTMVEQLTAHYHFFHWHLAFPQVFARGGFDCVLGNPPWVSFTGRQQVRGTAQGLPLLLHRFPCVARWPATHPAFMVLSSQIISQQGGAGLVLPRQVADLDAYGDARAAVTSVARLAGPVVDIGEDAFPGVTQPVGLVSFTADRTGNREGDASPWSVLSAAPEGGRDEPRHTELNGIVPALARFPRFEASTFTDPGVHTGNVSKKVVLVERPSTNGSYAPVREGKDIAPFLCNPARKWLWVNPELVDGEYCTIRDLTRYARVPILLRQTADRPIAAPHTAPTYFRNSLLACRGVPGLSDMVVVAFLNSALYTFLHQTTTRDANQKAFPQVKVRHLQSLPAIPAEALQKSVGTSTLGDAIESAANEAAKSAAEGMLDRKVLERLERLILTAFGLSPDLAPLLMEATK